MAGVFKLKITETKSELKTLVGQQRTAFGKERVQALYLLKLGKVKTIQELALHLGRNSTTWKAMVASISNKPRGGSLSKAQKQENHCLSQSHVICENVFTGIKHYNTVSGVYRNRMTDFDDRLMLTAAGLRNFYLIAA